MCTSPTSCTYCTTGFNLLDDGSHSCISASLPCPANMLKAPYSRICKMCPEGCKTCDSQFNCLTCLEDFLLVLNRCNPRIYGCPEGYFYDSSLNKCSACSNGCQSCNSAALCQKCLPSYFLNTVAGTCNFDCSALVGTYADAASRTCMIC